MNILFLVKFYQPFDRGGSEWSTHDLAKLLTSRGYSVTILTPNYGYKRQQVIEKINIKRIPFPIKLKNPKGKIAPFWTNNTLWYLYSFIYCLYFCKKNKVDIIHIHSNEFIPAAVLTSFITKIRTVVTFRDYQALCPLGFCLWDKKRACNLQAYFTKDFIFFWNNYVKNKNIVIFPLLLLAVIRAKIMQTIVKFLSKHVNLKIAVSKKVRDIFMENDIGNVEVIHNPILVSGSYKNSESTIVYVGKFSPGKGVNKLIEIIPNLLKRLKNVRIILIGSGQLEKEVKNSMKDYIKNKRVFITGQLAHEQVLKHVKQAGLVVVPSIWQEPLPRSVNEALLSATPVVATNVGGINEVLKDGVYGSLTGTKSKKIEDGIVSVFKKRSKIKSNLLKDIKVLRKNFSQDVVNAYIGAYKNLI